MRHRRRGGGRRHGAKWLCEQHPDKVRCDFVVNEGAGEVFEFDGRRLYGVCVAEKGVFRFTLSTEGRAGHASIPRIGDNALPKMAPVLERDGGAPAGAGAEPRARGVPRRDGHRHRRLRAAVEQIAAKDPRIAVLRRADARRDALADHDQRVREDQRHPLAGRARAWTAACRPGWARSTPASGSREVIGENGYSLEFDETVVGNRSPVETPLMDEIRDWVADGGPGRRRSTPTVLPGFTDSRWFREAFPDCVAYGFFPQRAMDLFEAAPLMHGADERIPVEDLGLAVQLLRPPRPEDARVSRGQAAARRHGPAQRAARARAHALGRGRAHQGRRDKGGVGAQAPARRPGPRARSRAARRGQAGRGDGGDTAGEARRCRRPGCRCRTCARWPRWRGAALLASVIRRAGPRTVGREAGVALISLAPALLALRGGDLAAYHGVEHKAIGAYEQAARPPTPRRSTTAAARTWWRRCWLDRGRATWPRARPASGPGRRGRGGAGRVGGGRRGVRAGPSATRARAWPSALRRPGYEIQRAMGTREPTRGAARGGRGGAGGDPARGGCPGELSVRARGARGLRGPPPCSRSPRGTPRPCRPGGGRRRPESGSRSLRWSDPRHGT